MDDQQTHDLEPPTEAGAQRPQWKFSPGKRGRRVELATEPASTLPPAVQQNIRRIAAERSPDGASGAMPGRFTPAQSDPAAATQTVNVPLAPHVVKALASAPIAQAHVPQTVSQGGPPMNQQPMQPGQPMQPQPQQMQPQQVVAGQQPVQQQPAQPQRPPRKPRTKAEAKAMAKARAKRRKQMAKQQKQAQGGSGGLGAKLRGMMPGGATPQWDANAAPQAPAAQPVPQQPQPLPVLGQDAQPLPQYAQVPAPATPAAPTYVEQPMQAATPPPAPEYIAAAPAPVPPAPVVQEAPAMAAPAPVLEAVAAPVAAPAPAPVPVVAEPLQAAPAPPPAPAVAETPVMQAQEPEPTPEPTPEPEAPAAPLLTVVPDDPGVDESPELTTPALDESPLEPAPQVHQVSHEASATDAFAALDEFIELDAALHADSDEADIAEASADATVAAAPADDTAIEPEAEVLEVSEEKKPLARVYDKPSDRPVSEERLVRIDEQAKRREAEVRGRIATRRRELDEELAALLERAKSGTKR